MAHIDLPLRGVRVVEFCTVAAGPFCGMLLADMGAEVWKIEAPQGDALRQWPPHREGFSENFASLNRNKRSAVLNLKEADDRELARRLILDSDVVIENNRPGVMGRLGLDYATLAADHPRLIYCSISAFGQTGPRAREGGFDLTIQAAAGVMSVTGEPDQPPVKCGVPIVDFASGLYAAYTVATALREVQMSGRGAHLDIPMFGCTLGIAALQTSEYFGNEKNPRRMGSAHPRNAPYQAYRAADGFFAIAAGNNKLWLAVCDVVALPHLADDPRFESPASRAANQTALKELLEPVFATATTQEWEEKFRQAGVPVSPINDYEAALKDPQTEYMGMVQDLELPGGAKTRTFGVPYRINGGALPIRMRPPALGEHTEELRARYFSVPHD